MIGHLPNLLIIGSAKSGTTSLHRYLDLHPAVSMSHNKELELFNRDDWRERLDWYRTNFLVRAPIRGESSPAYSMDPTLPGVPERIHEMIPAAKLIYMVRDPVERALAHYVEFVSIRLEHRPLERALADFDSGSNVYAMTSSYAHQLDLYRPFFPDAQILVLDQRDLRESRREVLHRTFAFLGVDADFWSPEFDLMHNTRERKMRANERGAALLAKGWLPRLRRWSRPLPDPLRERLKFLVADEVKTPDFPASLRDELAAYLREDADRLRAYTGQRFEHWSA